MFLVEWWTLKSFRFIKFGFDLNAVSESIVKPIKEIIIRKNQNQNGTFYFIGVSKKKSILLNRKRTYDSLVGLFGQLPDADRNVVISFFLTKV